MTRRHPRSLWFVTLVLLLAAFLRIYHFTQQSLWTDEGFTYNVIARADMLPEIAADTHPPLYYVLLKGWVLASGDSVLSLRFFSVLPSLLSVALMVPLAKTLTRGRPLVGAFWVPALAALMLALADSENFLAQEVRMYTLATLFAVLSVYGYARWYRQPQRRWAVLWVVSTTALIYTHYLGLYIPLIEGLHALLFLRGRIRFNAIGLLVIVGGLFLPWFVGVTLDQIATPPPNEMFNSQPSDLATLLDLRDKYLTGQWGVFAALVALGAVTLVYSTTILRFQISRRGRMSVAVMPSDRIHVHWRPLREPALVLMWLVLPVVITFVANAWLPVLTPRKIALIAPSMALLAAWGLGNLRPHARALMTTIVVLYGVFTVDFYQLKEPWNHVAADMTAYALPGDAALMEVGLGGYPLGYYLDHSPAFAPAASGTLPARNLPRWRQDAPDTYDTELSALLDEHDTVWLAYWSPETRIFEFLANAGLVQTAAQTTDHLGNDLNVYRYDRLPDTLVAEFSSGMILRDATYEPSAQRLDLWWMAERPLMQDYSVSAFVLDASGALMTQYDAFPFENTRPTTTWLPGDVVYDPHPLDTALLPPGDYSLGVKVYTYADNVVYPPLDGEHYAIAGTLTLP